MRRRAEAGRFAASAALVILALPGAAWSRADTLAEVQQATERGEFAHALELVRLEPDPLVAARAGVWVHYRARDFAAAYAAAERGLALDPRDLWLAERAVASALWLREVPRCERAIARLEAVLSSAPAESALPFRAACAEAREATARLASALRAAGAARSRAIAVTTAVLAGVLGALLFLARRTR